MGKKPQKTKEVWAAIAEASTTIDDEQQQQQPQTSRKRGRPRKIVVKMESSEEPKEEDSMEKQETKGSSEIETCMLRKEEETEVPKGVVSYRTSRARRKSKPTKSSH
ncbi:unnamed protein product [Lathyrus sativus]|nr:unnamed protein product [Lathyrus sativus]